MNDIVTDVILAVGDDGKMTEITPADRFHREARRFAALPGATYDSVLDGVVTTFNAQPGVVKPLKFVAKSSKGRLYTKALFALD